MESITGTEANEIWKINSLRYTIFPKPNYIFDNDSWQKIVGTLPDNVSFQLKNQIKHFDGVYDSGKFIIDVDPSRIHLVFTPGNDLQENNPGLINLGGYDETSKVFISLIDKWLSLDNCPTVNRMAVGGQLFIPVESKVEGYKNLCKFLHTVTIDPENSSEFLYQINRPRKSLNTEKELLINRLSKWQVLIFENAIQDASVKNTSQKIIASQYGMSLEFDMNTQGDFQGDLNPGDQKLYFKELLQLSNEISVKGDV